MASAANVLGFNDAFLVGVAVVLVFLAPALFLPSEPSAGGRRASSRTVEELE